jgi:hypothetical protein
MCNLTNKRLLVSTPLSSELRQQLVMRDPALLPYARSFSIYYLHLHRVSGHQPLPTHEHHMRSSILSACLF